jgi:PST family polysaccharide transporter/lipopolysaccharide exporter
MVSVIRVLAVWGALRSVVAIVGPLFRAVGKPEYNTGLQTFRLLIFGAAIYPATMAWGTTGTAIALVVSALAENPLSLSAAVREVEGAASVALRSLAGPATAALCMGSVVVVAERTVGTLSAPVEFGLLVLIGVGVYLAILLLGTHLLNSKLKQDVVALRRSLN